MGWGTRCQPRGCPLRPLNVQQAQDAGDGNLPCGLVVDHDSSQAGRAAAGNDTIFVEQRFARAIAGQVSLRISQAQLPIRDDPIELGHQRGFGQDRQLLQTDIVTLPMTWA